MAIAQASPGIAAGMAVIAVVVRESFALEIEAVVGRHAAHGAARFEFNHGGSYAHIFELEAQARLPRCHLGEIFLGFKGQPAGEVEAGVDSVRVEQGKAFLESLIRVTIKTISSPQLFVLSMRADGYERFFSGKPTEAADKVLGGEKVALHFNIDGESRGSNAVEYLDVSLVGDGQGKAIHGEDGEVEAEPDQIVDGGDDGVDGSNRHIFPVCNQDLGLVAAAAKAAVIGTPAANVDGIGARVRKEQALESSGLLEMNVTREELDVSGVILHEGEVSKGNAVEEFAVGGPHSGVVADAGAIAPGEVGDRAQIAAVAEGAGEGEKGDFAVSADDEVDEGKTLQNVVGKKGGSETAEADGEVWASLFDLSRGLNGVPGLKVPMQVEADKGSGMRCKDALEGKRAAKVLLNAQVQETRRMLILDEEVSQSQQPDGREVDEGEFAQRSGVVPELGNVEEEDVYRLRIGAFEVHRWNSSVLRERKSTVARAAEGKLPHNCGISWGQCSTRLKD